MRSLATTPLRAVGRRRIARESALRAWCARSVVFATVLSASIVIHTTANAQDAGTPGSGPAPRAPSEEALWLARICVHEAGFHSPDDCRAIWRVLERGARRHRTTPIEFARRYSRTVFDTTRTDPRGWITRLDASGEEPPGFPTTVEHEVDGRRRAHRHPPWASFREDWLRVLALAERVVRGEVHARCRAPDDWGGPMDAERAARLGLTPIPCGQTHNTFYARPLRGRRAARAVQITP